MGDDVSRILSSIPIESYISRFVPLKKKGSSYVGLCPFHAEKTPSFSVSPDKGIFKCFGCGKGGNLITFVMYYEKVEFLRALNILAEYAGITLSGKKNSEKDLKKDFYDLLEWVSEIYEEALGNSEAETYLKNRGISQEAKKHFHLGYAPNTYRFLEGALAKSFSENTEEWKKNYQNLVELGLIKEGGGESYNLFRDRLIFPIKNPVGKFVGFGGRIISEKAFNVGKYINSPESFLFHKKDLLFHLSDAKESIQREGQAILVEGYFDVLGLWEKGIYNVVAPLGTAFTSSQAKLLKQYTERLVIFFDQDRAGYEAAFQALKIARDAFFSVRVVHLENNSGKVDPFDISRKNSKEEILLLLDEAKDELHYVLWYFFGFRYDISQISSKKQAIKEFFNFLAYIKEDYEREIYLKEASQILNVSFESLQNDFKKRQIHVIGEGVISPTISHQKEEKILLFLLYFPEFLGEEVILRYFHPQKEEVKMLYSFLQDRNEQGEIVDITALSELFVVFQTPKMHDFLSGLLAEENLNKYMGNLKQKPKEELREILNKEVLSLRRGYLKMQIEEIFKNLHGVELSAVDYQNYQNLVEESKKIDQYLRKSSPYF